MLSLVTYPKASLNQDSERITVFDEDLKKLAEEMNEVMIREHGIGLAAPQIGKNIRLFIVKVGERGTAYKSYVNPEIKFSMNRRVAIEEGCLSLPGIYGYVSRSAKIHLRYQDLLGKKHLQKARGMEAIVLQHEHDHIVGTLIINQTLQVTKGQEQIDRWKIRKIKK